MLVERQKQQLDELGYLVLPNFVPPPILEEMRERVEALWADEGDDAGTGVPSRAGHGVDWPISSTKATFSRG